NAFLHVVEQSLIALFCGPNFRGVFNDVNGAAHRPVFSRVSRGGDDGKTAKAGITLGGRRRFSGFAIGASFPSGSSTRKDCPAKLSQDFILPAVQPLQERTVGADDAIT